MIKDLATGSITTAKVAREKGSSGRESKLLFLLVSSIASLLLSLAFSSISIFWCDVIGVFILSLLSRKMDSTTVKVMIIAKLVMVGTVLLVYYGNIANYGTAYYRGGSDDLHFEQIAQDFLLSNIYWPWEYALKTNQNGFYLLLSLLMRLFGGFWEYHTLAYRILNVNMLLAIASLTSAIFANMDSFSQKQTRIVFCAMAFFPNAIYISSYVFRDTLYTLIILVCFALLDDMIHNPKSKTYLLTSSRVFALILLCLLCFVGYWIRLESLYIIIILTFISAMKDKVLQAKRLFLYLVGVLVLWVIIDNLGMLQYTEAKIGRYSDYLESGIRQESSFISKWIFSQPILPIGWLARAILAMITPLPVAAIDIWHIFDDELTFLNVVIAYGTVAQILMLPYLFMNIRRIDKYVLIFLVLFATVFLVTFTFRHFIVLYPFLAILIFRVYFVSDKNTRKGISVASTMTLACLAVLYMTIVR